jgi:hypothetical protein
MGKGRQSIRNEDDRKSEEDNTKAREMISVYYIYKKRQNSFFVGILSWRVRINKG